MSRSCHSATFSMPAMQVGAQHAGETAELLALHRVALVGHRARALLRPGAERLLHLAHLGALQVTDLERERLDGGAHRRARVEQLRVTVAGEHLRGGHRLEPQRGAHVGLDRGVDVGVGADRARELAHRDRGPGPGEALPVAAHLQGPQRELHPEGGGLGVHPVGAPGHRGVAVGVGLGDDGRLELGRGADHEVEGPHQGDGEGGVDHVARREPVVDPAGGGAADALLDHVDEGRDVVLGDLLPLVDGGDVEIGPFADGHRIGGRDDPQLRPGLGGEDLDLQPGAEPGLIGEETGDLGQRVALYQGSPSSCRTL